MTKVFFSITSVQIPLLRGVRDVSISEGTVEQIIDSLNNQFPGIKPFIIDSNRKIRSRATLTKNVVHDGDYIFIDKNNSKAIKNLSEIISDEDNLFISIFDVDFFTNLLDNALIPTTDRFPYENENGKHQKYPYKGYVLPRPDYKIEKEAVNEFINGTVDINQLAFKLEDDSEFMKIAFRQGDKTLERFVKEDSHIIPSPLTNAINELLVDSPTDDVSKVYLRLFQEDSLFFILAKLWEPESIPERALLLSMPTGGGKTEAFVFPVMSHLLSRKAEILKSGGIVTNSVKALILYPTKALANDQAKRLAEIVQKVNASIDETGNLPSELGISIGIFTGDTLSNKDELRDSLGNFLSLFQVCPVCDQADFTLDAMTIGDKDVTLQVCNKCGHKMNYVRVTRTDIFNAPPDILITNPDTLNYHIQLPGRQATLFNDVEIIIFDEIHEYNGIFGCNVAHLLRRLEACRNGLPPLYVGLSATIGNAKNLASLLFNITPDEVLYIRDTPNRPYVDKNKVARWRYHYLLIPNMHDSIPWLRVYPLTATINVVSALGHAIRDPQFRKLLIFSNFKADLDKLSFQIPENERDYYRIYSEDLRPIFKQMSLSGDIPTLGKSDRTVTSQISRWYEWESSNTTLYYPLLDIGWHRGALEMEERVRAVNRFSSLNKIVTSDDESGYEYPTDVMVATKTLELGVDIGNVSIVMNSSSPFSNNDYVQRIGRGGRRKDSLAITIINPNNAIDAYLREHFSEFVSPIFFEDAPIVASNELIMKAHIRARILDYLSRVVDKKSSIQIGDWLDHKLPDEDRLVSVTTNPQRYAELLFTKIFPGNTYNDFEKWFRIESEVLNEANSEKISCYILNENWVIDVLKETCEILRLKTDKETKNAWDRNLELTGFTSVFPELRPSLRGSGKSVGLYLKKRNDDEWKDEISRDRAIYQNPPGSFQSQGRNLFIIEDPVMAEDKDTQEEITDLLVDHEDAYEHFRSRFPTSSLQNPLNRAHRWRFITPADLRVKHFPARYICPQCGLTYTSGEVTDSLRCLNPNCNKPLQQITRIYRCPQCSAIAEPPVPKICINPACIQKKIDKDSSGNINSKWNLRIAIKKSIKDMSPVPLRGFFKFKSRPNLTWECMDCHCKFTLHDRFSAEQLGVPLGQLSDYSLDGPNANLVVSWYGLYRPELPIRRKQTYLDLGYHLNGFDCPDLDHCPDQWRGGLRPVNHPRFQTDVDQFHIAHKPLGEYRDSLLGQIYFFSGDVISLAERYAVADPKSDDDEISEVTRHKIFENGELYATKFSPHMFGLRLRDRIDDFLGKVNCPTTSCDKCTEIAQLELGEIYRPTKHLGKSYIEDGKPIKPDPRAVWCELNKSGKCEIINCNECNQFNWNSLRRFAVLHTIKHGILWSLPKYTGLDVGSFKGVVNPGFYTDLSGVPHDLDLLIIDTNDGGSGAIHLVNRWWESHIVPMAIEILGMAALPYADSRRANLNLPYTCSWFNRNLCPILTGKFIAQL